jgi:hypothetical protein
MPTSKAATLTIVVTRSFGNLNEGDTFTAEKGDAWVEAHQRAGLLREVDGGGERPREAGEG